MDARKSSSNLLSFLVICFWDRLIHLLQQGNRPHPRILETNEGWSKGQKFCPPVVLHYHHHQPGQPGNIEYSNFSSSCLAAGGGGGLFSGF